MFTLCTSTALRGVGGRVVTNLETNLENLEFETNESNPIRSYESTKYPKISDFSFKISKKENRSAKCLKIFSLTYFSLTIFLRFFKKEIPGIFRFFLKIFETFRKSTHKVVVEGVLPETGGGFLEPQNETNGFTAFSRIMLLLGSLEVSEESKKWFDQISDFQKQKMLNSKIRSFEKEKSRNLVFLCFWS